MILVQTDATSLAADTVDAAAIALYLAAVRRLRSHGRRWPASSSASFTAGIACLWLAVGSGLATYDDEYATVHMVQHGLLMMVAPPLLALSRPVTLAIQASRRRSQIRLVRLVHSDAVASLTFPPATWLVYYGVMYACFLDRRLYDYLVSHPLSHDAGHVLLLGVGFLYWQPLIGGDPSRWRLSPRARHASVLGGTVVECVLAVAIMTFRAPLDRAAGLADTRMAGVFFLIIALLTCGVMSCVRLTATRHTADTGGAIRWQRAMEARTGPS